MKLIIEFSKQKSYITISNEETHEIVHEFPDQPRVLRTSTRPYVPGWSDWDEAPIPAPEPTVNRPLMTVIDDPEPEILHRWEISKDTLTLRSSLGSVYINTVFPMISEAKFARDIKPFMDSKEKEHELTRL